MSTINTNIGALSAQASMTRVQKDFSQAMTRLSSGLRINGAKDDAAGMAIADKMTAQIRGINQAVRNATDGKSLVDTTEAAHNEVSNMLQRMRELAVQSANDSNTASDRGNIVAEAKQLIAEINRIAENTTFNGMKVMDGSFQGKQFQIGADLGQTLAIDIDSAAATDIGAFRINSNVSLSDGTSGIAAGTELVISGFAGNATVTTTANQSAKELASSVNNLTSKTGVSAIAETQAKLSGLTEASKISFDVNGVSIGTVAVSSTDDLRNLADAINSVSSRTGVTATMGETNSEIILRDETGANISLTGYTSTDGAGANGEGTLDVTVLKADGDVAGSSAHHTLTLENTSAEDAVIVGQVSMTSTQTFSVGSSEDTAGESFYEDKANAAALSQVAEIDLSNAESAADAIAVIDVALQKVSQARSDLGAISNRLDSTISNLSTISVAVEDARSRVMDADFAKESTELARGQILSQASTAMLAQANSSQQNVLSLLN